MVNERRFTLKKDGTLYAYCYCRTPELIENYDKAVADDTQVWCCHHRLETHNSDGERRLVDLSKEELIALGMYYDRPPEELIFLTSAEHKRLHNVGKQLSEEVKRKISEAQKGQVPWNKGKEGKRLSSETRRKMSAFRKGKHWKLVDDKRIWY